MKKLDLGQLSQILANAGVVIGLILVLLELRQNNVLLEMQERANSIARITGTADLVLQSPHLIEVLQKDRERLTEAEHDTLVLLGVRSLSTFQTAFNDARSGLRDEESVRRAVLSVWHRPRLNYGMPLAWDTYKHRADPEFIDWMERNVIDAGAP